METFDAVTLALEQQTDALLKALEQDDLGLALRLADERQHLIERLQPFSHNATYRPSIEQLAVKMLAVDITMREYVERQKSEVEVLLKRLNSGNKAVKLYAGVSGE